MPHLAIGPAMLISSLVGAGASVAGGAMSGSAGARTSTTTPVLSPEMQALQKRLLDFSGGLMDDPSAGLGGLKTAAANRINANYAMMPRTVTAQLSGRGFGKSGKLGTALYNVEGSRLNDLTGLEGQFGQMAMQQRNFGANLADSLLNAGTGHQTVNPGSAAGDALMSGGNALSNLSSLLMLSKVLKG